MRGIPRAAATRVDGQWGLRWDGGVADEAEVSGGYWVQFLFLFGFRFLGSVIIDWAEGWDGGCGAVVRVELKGGRDSAGGER